MSKIWEGSQHYHERRVSDRRQHSYEPPHLDDIEGFRMFKTQWLTSWRWIVWIFSVLASGAAILFGYGYVLIADLKESVLKHHTLDEYRVQESQNYRTELESQIRDIKIECEHSDLWQQLKKNGNK